MRSLVLGRRRHSSSSTRLSLSKKSIKLKKASDGQKPWCGGKNTFSWVEENRPGQKKDLSEAQEASGKINKKRV